MARILGLDLGSWSVKGVVHEAALRGSQVRAYAEVRRPEGERAESLKAALKELLANPALHAEQVLVSLPGPSVATHQLQLPFVDPKRIEATIGFEVESQLPFDLSEAVFDYQVASQRDKKSDLLVGVVRKDELKQLLALLSELGLDPRVVTHPAVAYQGLFLQPPLSAEQLGEDEAVAVVDVGHERTTLAIGRPGTGVELGRTFPGGGRDLTRALAAELQLPLPEAAAWKEERGAVGDSLPPELERAGGALVRALVPVVRELRSTFKSYSARSRRKVAAVYLCGGTARLAGLEERWTADLGLPVRVLALPQDAGPGIPEASRPVASQAYALAARAPAAVAARAPRFNLRRGEFAFKGHFDYLRDRLGLLASYAATLLVLAIAAGVVRTSVMARRERQVDVALCNVTERVLHRCEKDYDVAISLLKGQESPAAALPRYSAVDLLAELTNRLPKGEGGKPFPVTFDQMVVDLERVSLRGQTESTRDVDLLTNAFKSFRCFHDVKQGKLEKTKDGSKVLFRLEIQVECPAEQAG
ncbi:MAG TPA: pilus assembly protein PilM [Myxococcaceae bacterium]|jgi:general secretion pathway protein L